MCSIYLMMGSMNRRTLLRSVASGVCAVVGERVMYALDGEARRDDVEVSVDESRVLGAIAHDFVGLGYEISSIARSGLLSASNGVYTQLVRTLGRAGVIRVGGNTSDYASYSAKGKAVSVPKGTVVNRESLSSWVRFLMRLDGSLSGG